MSQGRIVEILGRCWSYFELNIHGTISIQSDCLWEDSRDNSSQALSYYFSNYLIRLFYINWF